VIKMDYYMTIIIKMVLAVILGGVIGYERENTSRPAGFRTHILVCVGATLVMITSEYIFKKYLGKVNLDPARMGASVISGIGFLGAGTIIRDRMNVKGLTTAASLWAVACVGIATGAGFYEGAVLATILIYITLMLLKKMESHFHTKNYKTFVICSKNIPCKLADISSILEKHSVRIKNIEYTEKNNKENILIKFLVKLPDTFECKKVISEIQNIDGIEKVYDK
jgi:putative Mg2+ transporter-C (MgtC) family protein